MTPPQKDDLDIDVTRLAVVEQRLTDYMRTIDLRLEASREAVALALAAAEKGIAIALGTAEKAAAKAELAAGREYLEAQIDALKQTINAQLVSQKEAIQAALVSADKAVAKAEGAAEKRFESVNEFRSALADQQQRLATKEELNLRFHALEQKVEESSKTKLALLQGASDRISEMSERMRTTEGVTSGSRMTVATGITIIGVIIVAVGAIIALLNYLK